MSKILATDQVRFTELTPALARILTALELVARKRTAPPILYITAIHNGKHMLGSRHYTNEAVDFYTAHGQDFPDVDGFAAALRDELGVAFTVLYEDPQTPNAHLHCQPRRFTTYPPAPPPGSEPPAA